MIVAGDLVRGAPVAGELVEGELVGSGGAPVTPGIITLRRTLPAPTLSSTVTAVGQVSASVIATLPTPTLASTVTAVTPDPPTGESVRFAMVDATYSTADADYRLGEGGSNYFGAFIAIAGDGIDDHAWYVTHDGRGWDPQPYVTELAGYTMHAVDLPAGTVDADDVATALRTAIDGEALYDTVGGTGPNVDVTGSILAASCFTGESTPGTAASWGSHETTADFDSNPIAEAIHAFAEFTDGPAIITGIGARLASAGDDVAAAVYTGGQAASGGSGIVIPVADFDGTSLLASTVLTGSGTGWVWESFTPADVAEVADGTPLQLLLKGETTSTHGSFRFQGNLGTSDLTDQQLAVLQSSDVDPDPTVAWPSSLDAITDLSANFGVVLMIAIEYRQAPHRGDAGGITVTAL